MKGYLFGVVGLGCALVMGFAFLTNPRVETETVVKEVPVLPAELARASVLRAFANLEVAQEAIIPNPAGYPMICRTTAAEGDFRVFIQWCVRATLEEAAVGGVG